MDEKNSTEDVIAQIYEGGGTSLRRYDVIAPGATGFRHEPAAYDRGFDTGRQEGFNEACRWVLSWLRNRQAIRDWELAIRPPDKASGWSPLLGSAPWAATYLEAKMDELPAERPQ